MQVVDENRRTVGELRLSTLPHWPSGLWDFRDDHDADPSLEPVQIMEGHEYRYELVFQGVAAAPATDHPELFIPDTADGRSGRLRPGLATGLLPVEVTLSNGTVGQFSLEVRSKKLGYITDYRWMLRDIAEQVAEVVMERFSASEQRFAPDSTRDSQTLYQRFAFLKSILEDESFQAGIQRVISRPHITWHETEATCRPGQGFPNRSHIGRQLARAGRRLPSPSLNWPLGESGVPAELITSRSDASVDNTPNRFVKFALTRWRDFVNDVEQVLLTQGGQASARGVRDAAVMRKQLDAWLSEELFREVSNLDHFPGNDQVLQKREGYRDVLHRYLLLEVAAQLSWAGGDHVYGAGQKDVATLYEYWTFLQLALAISEICGKSFDWDALLERTGDAMSIDLKRGKEIRLAGFVTRQQRTFELELWFNRTFGVSANNSVASWSRPMRPDCSLQIRGVGFDAAVEPVWLHFDAKYRVDGILGIMSAKPVSVDDESRVLDVQDAAERRGEPKREDLLKMHAYRDAIRRSAGAYVLYPGTEEEICREYHELLPGLGAFALRPTLAGDALGMTALRHFLGRVVDHVASQISQHERGRYWNNRAYAGPAPDTLAPPAPFLRRLPADTRVLLGYVKSAEHLEWIRRNRRYNLRADDRSGSITPGSAALGAEIAVLYAPAIDSVTVWSVGGQAEVFTRQRMLSSGYPRPRDLYLCIGLEQELSQLLRVPLSVAQLLDAWRRYSPNLTWGEPTVVSWLALVGADSAA